MNCAIAIPIFNQPKLDFPFCLSRKNSAKANSKLINTFTKINKQNSRDGQYMDFSAKAPIPEVVIKLQSDATFPNIFMQTKITVKKITH